MVKQCRQYVGVSCVNGSCPVAMAEESEDYCKPVIKCVDCFYYKGCDDCCLYGTEYCSGQQRRSK